MVSEKHAGFIINNGNATAKDVLDLIEIIKQRVKEKYDVELKTEMEAVSMGIYSKSLSHVGSRT